nr:glycosyltransferase family 2 protein [Bifidobacterium catenulatum]
MDGRQIVSVIVPVYGVERYLDRCIKSIVEQDYKQLDIVVVDDGSPDRCPQLCDEWAARDSRIRVVHKKEWRSGLGQERGIGHHRWRSGHLCGQR